MTARRGGKAKRSDDGRLAANRRKKAEAEGRAKPPEPKSRYQMLIDGDLTVSDLDDEEVARGRTKDKNGNFSGRPPKGFPRELHDALHNEFIRRTNETFKPLVEVATQVLLDVALNRRAAAPARVQAANILLERGAGKVKDQVVSEIIVKKFEENIQGLFVDVPDEVAAKRAEKSA